MPVSFAPIRVFLVDDSPLALLLLKRMLATSPEIEIVGTARDGKEALSQFEKTRPKVICTDYQMPVMNGLELVKETLAVYPRPILVISSLISARDHAEALPLLAAGAVDVFPKPTATSPFEQTARDLVRKIKILAGVYVVSRRKPTDWDVKPSVEAGATKIASVLPSARPLKIVAIGASTGGPQVLQTILSALPAQFPCPILCVQHISTGFLEGLVKWLDDHSRLRVKIAQNGEIAQNGTVYFPPENRHLEINEQGQIKASDQPSVDGHKPSVTVTFESVAKNYRRYGMAILLTGMGSDGAGGLHEVHQVGGLTVAQNEESCIVFGMPRQAIERGAAQVILPPAEIAQYLIQAAKS